MRLLPRPSSNSSLTVRWLLVLAALIGAAASAQQTVPALKARVTDLTGTLTAAQQATLEEKLSSFEARKGAQLAVLIVPTTEPEDIEQYSIRVVDQWKLGREASDDGALLLVAKNDRRMRIEVGQGLEGALNDATSRRIIADTITPLFRQGDFFGGINAGLDRMIRVIEGEALRPSFHWSTTRMEYSAMSSGSVVATISTATCEPLRPSKLLSFSSSSCCWVAVSVPVRSVTRAFNAGTVCWANASSDVSSRSAMPAQARLHGEAGAITSRRRTIARVRAAAAAQVEPEPARRRQCRSRRWARWRSRLRW